jgi:hypothetical protein
MVPTKPNIGFALQTATAILILFGQLQSEEAIELWRILGVDARRHRPFKTETPAGSRQGGR